MFENLIINTTNLRWNKYSVIWK